MRSNLFSLLLLLLPVFALADGDRGAKRALQSMAVPLDLNTARAVQVPRMELVVSYEPLHVTKDGDVLAPEVPLNEVHAWKLSVRDLHGRPVTLAERGLRIEGDMPQHSH